ncbi:MAG: DUF1801 domain-containing protein [Balneolaceae bacterium]|nr:DUF1801 domain-containing protein [Balneolaceae bacterium]
MIAIPLETYPETYNGQPLSYLALAAQKNHYALYMMCVYQNPELMQFLKDSYQDADMKLDMGKSCLRFKNLDQLHEEAIAKIVASTEPEDFISQYEQARKS